MTDVQQESPAWPGPMELYQWWWLHDARWYQEVSAKCGTDVANELNQNAVTFVAKRVGAMVRKKVGKPLTELSMDEIIEAYRACAQAMFPPGMIDWEIEGTGGDDFQVKLHRNFAVEMSKRAGTLETYQCPCLSLREGWFSGLGGNLAKNEIGGCLKSGDACCTLLGTVERPETGEGS